MFRLHRMLTRRGFLSVLAALSILAAALAFGAPGAAAQNSPSKPATPAPPNEEYLRKVIKWNPWFLAAASGDAKTIQDYLTSGTQINARDTFGRTALYIATAYEHADIVRLLLKSGADPNLPSEGTSFWSSGTASRYQTVTAREAAGKSGNKEIEAALAEVEAKKESPPSLERKPMETPSPGKSTTELPPFFQAIADNSSTTLCSLLEKEHFDRAYDDHRYNTMYGTLPEYALSTGRENLYRILLEHGLAPSSTQQEKDALLKAAFEYGHGRREDIRRLLDVGASPYVVSSQGLAAAIGWHDADLLKRLLDSGVKPLDWLFLPAAGTNDLEIAKMLESYGARVSGEYGSKALEVAVRRKNKAMMEYLLSKGANPNWTGEDAFTLVERAVLDKRQDLADLLVQKGAPPISEERRSFLLNPPGDDIVTTEILISDTAGPTTSALKTIDLNRYTLYEITHKENVPQLPRVEVERFLMFTGSPDRIHVGCGNRELLASGNLSADGADPKSAWTFVQDGDRQANSEWINRAWLEPGKTAVMQCREAMGGQGGGVEEWMGVLGVKGKRAETVLSWNRLLYLRSGVGNYTTGNQAWSWDSREKVLSVRYTRKGHSEMDLHTTRRLIIPVSDDSGDEVPRSVGGTETTWRYQLAGEEMRCLGGKQVENIAGGFPVLDVAEEYGLTIRKLVELNPELRGKVFCAGPVVVSTSISPIDKDR